MLARSLVKPNRQTNLLAGSDKVGHASRVKSQKLYVMLRNNLSDTCGGKRLVDCLSRQCRKIDFRVGGPFDIFGDVAPRPISQSFLNGPIPGLRVKVRLSFLRSLPASRKGGQIVFL